MAGIAGRKYAVKHVNSPSHALQNVDRCSHAHEVTGFFFGRVGFNGLQDFVHGFGRLPHR